MNKTLFIALMVCLAALPAGLAHSPPAPKDFCESTSDWAEHDYLTPGSSLVVGGDGNLSGDCNGDGVPADYDGHLDYGLGGGVWLKAALAVAPCADADEDPHHSVGGPFGVVDSSFGGIAFDVTADSVDLTGTDPCGDNVADEGATCVDSCSVAFGPGLDGYYVLFVETGTGGHAYSPGGGGGGGHPFPIDPLPPLPDVPSVRNSGPAVVMQFDGSGGPPSVTPAPGWSCTSVVLAPDGLFEADCEPQLGTRVFLPECLNPFGVVGGTPVSFGSGTVRVGCSNFSPGASSASCTINSWTVTGGCLAPLPGFYQFPLRCAARVTGTAVGGSLFAACGEL